MSDEARCACCDLPTYSCGRALEQQRRREPDGTRLGGGRPALYPGRCATCGESFEVDDAIVRVVDGWQAVACCGS